MDTPATPPVQPPSSSPPVPTTPPPAADATAANIFQQMYNQGGKFKQELEALASATHRPGGAEHEPVRIREAPVEQAAEVPTQPELEKKPDLAGYVEKVEKEAELAQPIVDDYTNQVLMTSANPQKPVVKLPMTQEEIELGLHRKVWEGVRWIAEWCVRQAKLMHGNVQYKETK